MPFSMPEKIDIGGATPLQWSQIMASAVRLGASDATDKVPDVGRRGADLAAMWGVAWRKGHARALRQAYLAGRFHVETMGWDD